MKKNKYRELTEKHWLILWQMYKESILISSKSLHCTVNSRRQYVVTMMAKYDVKTEYNLIQ